MKTRKFMMIKHIVLILFALLCYLATAQEAPYSLEQCVSMALTNNEQLRNSRLEAQSSEYKIREIKSALLPTVDLNSQYLYYTQLPAQYVPAKSFGGPDGQYNKITLGVPQSTTVNMQVSQNIFNQSVMTGLKAAKVWQEASELQVNLTQDEIIYNVATAYYSIQVLQDNLNRTQENIINLEKTVAINQNLKGNDIISENVYNRLSINLENLKNQYESQKLLQEKYVTMLKYVMNVDASDELTVAPFDYNAKVETPEAMDINERSDIKLQQMNIRLAEFDKKSVMAGYYPVSAIGFNYGLSGYNNEFAPGKAINGDWINSSAVSLSIKIPVFDGFQKHNKIRQREIAIRKNQNSLSMMKSNAERELQDAINNYNTSSNQYANNKKSLELAEQLFTSAKSEFESGITTTTDFLNAQNDLTNARSNYSTALLNLKLAELSWQKASGKLSQSFIH